MDQGVRVVLAMGIVTGGTVLALLFRHPSPPGVTRSGETCQPLVLRGTTVAPPPVPEPFVPVPRPAPSPKLALPEEPATVPRVSLDSQEPTPLLARSYPAPSEAPWGTALGIGLQGPRYEPPQERTHKIVDGDTLAALAKRYLGSADRATELYEANKHLLPSPDVLPIGVELCIPASRPAPTSAASPSAANRLAPVGPRPSSGR